MPTLTILSDFWDEWKEHIHKILFKKENFSYECYPFPKDKLIKNKTSLSPFFLTYEIKSRKGDNSSLYFSCEKISGLVSWNIEVNLYSYISKEQIENQEFFSEKSYETQEDILLILDNFLHEYNNESEKKKIRIFSCPESPYFLEEEEGGNIFTRVKKTLSLESTRMIALKEIINVEKRRNY